MSQLVNIKLCSIMRDQQLRKWFKKKKSSVLWPLPTALGRLLFLILGYSSEADHLPSMYKAQEPIPRTVQNDKQQTNRGGDIQLHMRIPHEFPGFAALGRAELRWHLSGGCVEWLCSKEHTVETGKDSTWGLLVSGDLVNSTVKSLANKEPSEQAHFFCFFLASQKPPPSPTIPPP